MAKNHHQPEFLIIRQVEANAKFFVASGTDSFSTGMENSGNGPQNTETLTYTEW